VVDQQVVLMKFGDGASVTLTMHGHAHQEHRTTKIEGSHGRLMADFGMGGSKIVVDEHRSDWHMEYDTSADVITGHGGGDMRLMQYFVDSVNNGDFETALQTTREALESHLQAFAAEESRLAGKVLKQDAWQ
jgi:predicted dehydrogenase